MDLVPYNKWKIFRIFERILPLRKSGKNCMVGILFEYFQVQCRFSEFFLFCLYNQSPEIRKIPNPYFILKEYVNVFLSLIAGIFVFHFGTYFI